MKEITNYKKIESIFKRNDGFVTRKDIDKERIPSWFFSEFVKKNHLRKIAPGFYASDDYAVDDYFIFQMRYPKYIFSGMSALYLHHLTDRIPDDMTVTCPQGYHPSKNPLPCLKVTSISNQELYALGIIEIETMFGNKVSAYDKERAICDLIKYRDEYDGEVFLKAIKTYVNNYLDQMKLFKYAKQMKIEKKVFEIMEVVSNEN